NKSLVSTTPLSTAFFSSSIVQDFQDSPDDEEDTRSSHEYLNDLEEEYQERALLAKYKRFFKKGTQSKEGAKNGEEVKISMIEVQTLLEIEDNDDRKVYLDYLCTALNYVKEQTTDDTKVAIPCVERPWLSKVEGFIIPNHDTGRILPAELQRNTTDPSVNATDSLETIYGLVDKSSVCSTPLLPLKKSDALAKGNKSSSALKVHSAPAGKLKSVKIEDDPPLTIVMKELNNIKIQVSKNNSSYSRSNQSQQFDEKRGTIFNFNKEVVMIDPRDIYAAGSESRPPMLNKENYVPWSSRLLRYAKSRPNGKLIHNSILNGQYVRRMIPEPCDANRDVNVTETFHEQTDDELSEKELKQIEADDQAIQTIILGLPEDIYAAVDTDSENHPHMLHKENYVPWSSRLLRDPDRKFPANGTFHEQTDEELTEKELK
nr:retrovirus-related Pol polyprotein from transposon TNT 1-94 [Tanacetum cinerariifolium]